jgi:hypothetical protein
MTTKHTPGPWTYEQETKTIRSVPANYWIATIDSYDGAINNAANAALIAAAPELLEALKEIVARYSNLERLYFEAIKLNESPDTNGTIVRALSAIAKAEGKVKP